MGNRQQERQAVVRAATGTAGSYNDDWMALFRADGYTGTFNDCMLAWLNAQLSASYGNINDAMLAFAKTQGFSHWDEMGTFTIGGGGGPSGDGILLESGDFLLLETGDYALLE